MRTIVLLCLLVLPAHSYADSDFAVTWSLSGGLTLGFITYTTIELDINVETRYYSVSGGLVDPSQFTAPLTGTCINTAVGGLFCTLQLDQITFNFTINVDLNGTLEGKDSLGFPSSSTVAFFIDAV